MSSEQADNEAKPWSFVTNHTRVLLTIAHDPNVRVREIAQIVGITERAAQRIVSDLTESGYVVRERVGRRNHYVVNPDMEMRHRQQAGREIGGLLELLRLDQPGESERA
jgi:DNA-binding MarR family transcriptional regulator